MHDYARLDTIMHDFLLRFRLRLACGGQESFHLSSGCRSYRGRDGGQGLAGGVRSDLAIFFAFRHKKYFFLPLLTFIDLYPPLLGWSGAEGDAGRRTAGRKRVRATLAQDPPRGGGRNAVPADADDCRPILMLLTGVSHSEGIVKAYLEKSAGADERGLA